MSSSEHPHKKAKKSSLEPRETAVTVNLLEPKDMVLVWTTTDDFESQIKHITITGFTLKAHKTPRLTEESVKKYIMQNESQVKEFESYDEMEPVIDEVLINIAADDEDYTPPTNNELELHYHETELKTSVKVFKQI